ncbi:MAG: hypothetical protein ACFWTZ_07650 [Burkholderia sp.]|jgi:ferredoxin
MTEPVKNGQKTEKSAPCVTLRREACLRFRHAAAECTKCFDACTAHAIEWSDGAFVLHPRKCTLCGACAAACDLDAVALPRGEGLNGPKMLEAAKKGGTAVFACSQSAAEDGALKLRCLNALRPVDLLAAFAEGAQKVELLTGACASCPRKSGASPEKLCEKTHALAAAAGFAAAFRIRRLPGGVSLEKRFFFRRLAQRVSEPEKEEEVQRAVPGIDTWCNPADDRSVHAMPKSRAALLAALDALQKKGGAQSAEGGCPGLFFKPRLDAASCIGCSLCTAACPTGALSEEKEGESLRIFSEARGCTGCGLCRSVCFKGAVRIEDAPLSAVLSGEKTLEYEKNSSSGDLEGTEVWEGKLGKMFGDVPVYTT